MREFFRLLQRGDEQAVIELRALNYEKRKNNTFSGYFDQEDDFVARKLATQKSGGVYCNYQRLQSPITISSCQSSHSHAELTTSDQDIIQRRYLPIDLDLKDQQAISSSDKQHAAAIERSREVYPFTHKNGVLPSVLILAMVRTCCCFDYQQRTRKEPSEQHPQRIGKALHPFTNQGG